MPGVIIDPTARRTQSVAVVPTDAPRPESLDGLRIGLLGNTKRNADVILDAVGATLAERYDVAGLVPLTKTQFAMPLPDELIEDLVRECDVVVIGVGDCGSCSASAVADGITMEIAGVPAAVIATTAFESTSRAMAGLKNAPEYPFLLTEHPIANLTAEQIADRAGALADEVVSRLVRGGALAGAA
jgi:hypothetical protein